MQANTSTTVIIAQPRTVVGKEMKILRQDGWLPVHLYGKDLTSKALQVKTADFEKIFKEVGEIVLIDLQVGTEITSIFIKNVQLHPESHTPIHADFYQIDLYPTNTSQLPTTQQQTDKIPAPKRPLLQASLVAFSVVLLFSLTATWYLNAEQKTPTATHTLEPTGKVLAMTTKKHGLPMQLKIPSINVSASIEHVGLTPNGEMDVPSNTIAVGWFKLGSQPGEKGSAVISGHFDGKNGEVGVFNNLHKLKKGDKLFVKDEQGTQLTFIVRESRTFDPGYASDVFNKNDKAYLNLITCDGVWDYSQKTYSKRLVVFADITD